jgi:hypothetical protein
MLLCACTVPFGAPVEPDEYSQKHASSRVVGTVVCSGFDSASSDAIVGRLSTDPPEITIFFSVGIDATIGASVGQSCADTNSTRARQSRSM